MRDERYLGLATRICAELGAQIVKTYYCETGFEHVTAGCPVPVVMAGGKKLPELDALTMAYRAIQEGAAGVDMGRNIFQSDSPVAMIQAVGKVVHESMKPGDAFEFYKELANSLGQERTVKTTVRQLLDGGPTISVGMLTADLLRLGDELAVLQKAGASVVHVDVMDGVFCPQFTVGPPDREGHSRRFHQGLPSDDRRAAHEGAVLRRCGGRHHHLSRRVDQAPAQSAPVAGGHRRRPRASP